MTHDSAAQRRLKEALPSRKARSVIDEVATQTEKNGPCLRMSISKANERAAAERRATIALLTQ
jgi:hypothetical protein